MGLENTTGLPTNETNQFKLIIVNSYFIIKQKHYENKDFKKALKTSEDILKKFPDHHETSALQGLILQAMGRGEEAYQITQKAVLASNNKNANCYQIYGIMFRNDKNYVQAAKHFLNASKIQTDNYNLLKDLAFLQSQIRDYKGLVQTRTAILKLKKEPSNWVGYAVSLYLLPNYEMANKVMDTFLKDLDEVNVLLTFFRNQYLHMK